MFRKNDYLLVQKDRTRSRKTSSKRETPQSDDSKPVPEETSMRSRLRERFPKLFGVKKSKIIPVVSVHKEESIPARLMDIDSTVFAQEITMLEKEMFFKIDLKEILDGQRNLPLKSHLSSPNIKRTREFHLRLAMIVATEVVSQNEAIARAQIIAKVIEFADCCANLYNYHAIKTLLGALQTPPVARLLRTWKKIPRRSKSLLRHLIVLSSASQYALYLRHTIACQNSPNSLQFVGDVIAQINYIDSVVYRCRHIKSPDELQDLLSSYQDAARGYCFERHPAVAKFLISSARVNSVTENLELSKKSEPDSEEKRDIKQFYF